MPHRTVRVTNHGLGVAATKELAERAITDRVVQLAYHSPIGRQLELEVVTEQQQGSFGDRQVGLFCVVPAILDATRELNLFPAVAQADSRRLAIGFSARLGVAQLPKLGAGSEIPALFRHKVDSRGVREAGHRPAILVSLLDIDAGAI